MFVLALLCFLCWKGDFQTEKVYTHCLQVKNYFLLKLILLTGLSHPKAAVSGVLMVATKYL